MSDCNVLPFSAGRQGLTIAELARTKRLSEPFLSKLGLVDLPKGAGVGIPYLDETSFEIAMKRRTSLKAKDGSYWPKGVPLSAYGRWKIHEVREHTVLFLVEGESDCWTLWHHGLPALGLPGSSTAKTLTRELITDVQKLYVHIEPDQGGATFEQLVLRRLVELKYEGQTFLFRMAQGTKDLSDLHIADPERFMEGLTLALKAARPASRALLRTEGGAKVRKDPGESHAVERFYEADTVLVANVPVEKVRWLWPGRIPLGKLTILDGDPGLGKSTVTLDLAARVTAGLPMPYADPAATIQPARVILLSAEDGLADTVRPRLEAAGAQLNQVVALTSMIVPDDSPNDNSQSPSAFAERARPISLPSDIAALQKVIEMNDAKLVVIDPLMAFLDEDVHVHNDQSVRRALHPLGIMAEKTGAAVLVVRHLNKQPGRNMIYRGGGSIGIIGAVRSGLIVCKDPESSEQRLLGVSKSNLCKPPRALRYALAEGEPSHRVVWLDESDQDLDEIFSNHGEPEPGVGMDAEDFLQQRLADGEAPTNEIMQEAAALHISEKTLRRAKTRLAVEACFIQARGPFPAHWVWKLPG